MVKEQLRRQADPQMVQHLWEAITLIRNQRQVANKERILKYMHRQFSTPQTQCSWEIGYAAQDGLVVKEISTGKKGSRAGLEQEAFWCVEDTDKESEEKHDWYCFTCHKPGKVWCCSTCHRVYHAQCVPGDYKVNTEEEKEWSCAVCESLTQKKLQMSRRVLFKLLNFVLARMKDKARELHRKLKLETLPNYFHLVYRHIDLGTLIEKLEQREYKSLEEFEADAQDMVHTCAVYYGVNSDRMRLSQLTLNDCRYDLAEIRLCIDCYLSSNNKVGKDWFCRPCDPTHEIAWVHMKGFGYWPAKILCRNQGRVDVRFFGKRHERALVPEEDVKHISTPVKALRTKQSKGWQNAFKEMEDHKRMVQEGVGPIRDEVTPEEAEAEKKSEKKGVKRKSEQREAEKFIKKSHSDAGQVNSISTSEEYSSRIDNNHSSKKSKKKASKEPPAPDTDQSQESPISQDLEANPGNEEQESKQESPRKPPPQQAEKHKHKSSSNHGAGSAAPKSSSNHGAGSAAPKESGSEGKEKTKKGKNSNLDEADVEAKYRKKLADYKAHQEMEIQSRIEVAVAEAVSLAQKKWETERSESEVESVAQNEASLSEARKEEREKVTEELAKETIQLKEKHKEEISQTKKRQWCINCEQEAMYHCCWNTSYCSISCQQIHWHKEHKRLCRRKR